MGVASQAEPTRSAGRRDRLRPGGHALPSTDLGRGRGHARSFAAALALGAGLSCALAAGACGGQSTSLACPLLAPGALAHAPRGASLTLAGAPVSSLVAPGALAAHATWLAAGETVEVSAAIQGNGALFLYGPRDAFGGFPHCVDVGEGPRAKVSLTADEDGEVVVLVGAIPGSGTVSYTIEARCTDGCSARADRCTPLADLGCWDARCDGELARDAAGCLTCTCDAGALCGPDRVAGPGGSCVLPACTCAGAPAEPVCGADGRTWSSPCEAACAGVPVARDGPCDIACPALEACTDACVGLRTIGADGCPTCACTSTFAGDAASCAACPLEVAPVCGSDGVTYPNRCRARCAGARVLYAAACSDACRDAPEGCTLDCADGLRPIAGGAHCLACACADVPTSCDVAEGPVCAALPGPIGETTVGSGCVALALGATDGVWGACGVRCGDERGPCPEGTRCRDAGFFEGRCLADEDDVCGCSALYDPVCGVDGVTWENVCRARCAGVEVAHLGACCGEAAACGEGEVARLDARGCAVGCGAEAAASCAANAAFAPACTPDGAASEGSACAAHARGVEALPEWCP